MTAVLIVLPLVATNTLTGITCWWLPRWRAYRHQIRATRIAVTDPTLRAQALAWHRRQLRLPRLHLPHFHFRRAA